MTTPEESFDSVASCEGECSRSRNRHKRDSGVSIQVGVAIRLVRRRGLMRVDASWLYAPASLTHHWTFAGT